MNCNLIQLTPTVIIQHHALYFEKSHFKNIDFCGTDTNDVLFYKQHTNHTNFITLIFHKSKSKTPNRNQE
jgi:hypothetical protein